MKIRLAFAIAVALTACSKSKEPQWIEVGQTPDAILYSEPAIERPTRKINLIAMRSLNSHTVDQRLSSGLVYRSLVYTGLYNCAEGTWCMTHAEFFSQPMGKGKRVDVHSFTVDEALKKMAKYEAGSPAQLRFVDACERGLK